MAKKNNKTIITVIVGIVLLILLMQCKQPIAKESKSVTNISGGGETFKLPSSGGGGGGVPPNGDPDEPCENCELIWIENSLSDRTPGFSIPEYISRNGLKVPTSNGDAPTGHWECRGECPLKNGYKQICKPMPKIIPKGFGEYPTSKFDIEMQCICMLEDPCHIEFGNIFCERGIPTDILDNILASNVEGNYMNIAYSKIREHCRVARCEGGCAKTGEKCLFDTIQTDTGTKTTCKCKGDTCRKEYITIPTKIDIINNVDYKLTSTLVNTADFRDLTKRATELFRCTGECIDRGKICQKEGDNCVCKIPEGPMPSVQACNAVQVNGDNDWYKCLRGMCDQVPFCYVAGVPTPGWYMGSTFIRADSNCAGATAYCGAIGTRSQGWYSSYDDRLITYDNNCNTDSPCFYNTYTNKCECTPYTANCAWKIDWDSFSGGITDTNHPNRYCYGNCPYQLNEEQTCEKTTAEYGEECKCIGVPSQDPCNSICIGLNKNYKTGRTIQSYSECTNTVEEVYTDSSGLMCCCSFASPTQTCQSEASASGYSYYQSPVNSGISCTDISYADCARRGMVYNGAAYNMATLCCMWNCKTSSSGGDMDNDGIPDNQDSCPTKPGTKLNNGCPLTTTRTLTTTRLFR